MKVSDGPLRTRMQKLITSITATLVVACAAATPAAAKYTFQPSKDRETHLLSKAFDGGFPNASSQNGAFSQDRQLTTLAAYDSFASNILPGDVNGTRDVFLVFRNRPYNLDGPPWRARKTVIASQRKDGVQGNGPSYLPDIDGEQRHGPSCVAFISAASNLVPGDTNGKPDAFIKYLKSGQIKRVSVNSQRQQALGKTTEVKVDGDCRRVAFVSDAPNLALTRTSKKLWRTARTSAPPPGTRQVYVRILDGLYDNKGLRGLTFMASASSRGAAGNGHSFDVGFARAAGGCPQRCGDFSGEDVVFASAATNLSAGDPNPRTDVYKRTFKRAFSRLRRLRVLGKGSLRMKTRLVSATSSGRAGNGASRRPVTEDQGRYIAFETKASDLLPGDSNGVSDIARADTAGRRVKQLWVSRSREARGPGNGGSYDPAMTRPASPIFFTSDATNLQPNPPSRPGVYHDTNGASDVFLWGITSGNASLNSRDSKNNMFNLPKDANHSLYSLVADHERELLDEPGYGQHVPHTGSSNPATSYLGNYMLFETAYPLVDLPLAAKEFPGLGGNGTRAAGMSKSAKLRQVYLRYIGPRGPPRG